MTDWDNLCEEFEVIPVSNGITLGAKWKQVRAVGDAMQQENVQLRKDVKELANMGSDDLKKRVACQKENEALKIVTAKLFNKLADEQQKLEAIREIAEPYRNHCIKAVDKILEALGVLKEMQKEEQV